MMAKSFKAKAERYKADYELEAKRREQKESDLKDAEARIKTLRAELAFLEESFGEFEVVAKRPFAKSDLDSPELLRSEKRVRIEEVPGNRKAIDDEQAAASIKDAIGIKILVDPVNDGRVYLTVRLNGPLRKTENSLGLDGRSITILLTVGDASLCPASFVA